MYGELLVVQVGGEGSDARGTAGRTGGWWEAAIAHPLLPPLSPSPSPLYHLPACMVTLRARVTCRRKRRLRLWTWMMMKRTSTSTTP